MGSGGTIIASGGKNIGMLTDRTCGHMRDDPRCRTCAKSEAVSGCAEKIRLLGIDTPETRRPRCENELRLGLAANSA